MSRVARRPRRNGGFTVVELLLVAAVLGIVARIAIPNVAHVLHRARAADLVSDMRLVEAAAVAYLADHDRWPADAPAGEVPPGLEAHLTEGFEFRTDGWTLDWDLWELPDGLPGDPGRRSLPAVSVVPEDPALEEALRRLTVEGPWLVLGDTHTYLVLE